MNRVPFTRLILTVAILAGTSTIRADEPAKPDPKDAEIAALRAKLKAQTEEIQKLRAELKDLKALRELKVLVQPPQAVPAPGALNGNGQGVPPTWIPREFNGTTYYLIPLGGEAGRTNAVTTVAPMPSQQSRAMEGTARSASKP
jgi:hypothetical protein